MDLELSGRVAIVTGASKGIGLAVVRTLVEEGALVAAAIAYAIGQPPDVDVNELVIRPTRQR